MAILDAFFNISKRSMMPKWHQLDSSTTIPTQQDSTKKKKTLKSSSRSFWFSTGLCHGVPTIIKYLNICLYYSNIQSTANTLRDKIEHLIQTFLILIVLTIIGLNLVKENSFTVVP